MSGVAAYVSRLLRARLDAHGQILAASGEVQGVVLFVDLVGSTALTDRIATVAPEGAEQLGRMLNRYFANVIATIEEYGGDAVRIDGDAVIALWQHDDTAALRAAAAAIALRDGLPAWHIDPDWQLQHRLTLASGRLSTAILSCVDGRRFFVLAGAPLRKVGAIAHDGQPGEIVVDADLALSLCAHAQLDIRPGSSARLLAAPEPGDAAQAEAEHDVAAERFVPRIVVERSRSGYADWLAEFRILSMVYVRLSADAQSADRLQPLLDTIDDATRALGVDIYDVVADDKGIIAKIACGLPPLSLEGNASRALEIAQRIRAGLARLGLACPIGVATGRAFCGEVGTAQRREYLLTGTVMNYGARLMQASEDEILCDEATARVAGGRFTLLGPEAISIKGRSEPLPIYRLADTVHAAVAPLEATGGLHGRDAELSQLVRWIDLAPQPGLIAIEAEPGAGKSRLLLEFGQAARQRGCVVVFGATHAIEQTTAWFVFRAILRALLLRPDDPLPAAPALLRRRLDEALAGDPLAARAALLEDILPFDFADKGITGQIVGAARLAGIEDLVVALATRATQSAPLLLLIDDLHWLDELSAQLLHALARRVPGLLIAAASRPRAFVVAQYAARLLDAAAFHLALAPLNDASVIGLLCEVLGVSSIPQRLADFVQRQSEGLPLHAEQLALSLREKGLVLIVDGRCRITAADLGSAPIPANLHELILSRIDSLQQSDQLAARIASAIGRVFDTDTLRQVHEITADLPSLQASLARLVGVGILVADPESPAGTYAFRHALIQETTYGLLSYAHRRPLHHRIARLLEQRHAADLAPHFAELAEHWERAREDDRSIAYRLRAADLALRRYANDDALVQVHRAERVAAQGRSPLTVAQQMEMARVRGEALHALSRFSEASEWLRRCAGLNGTPVPVGRFRLGIATVGEFLRQLLHRGGVVRQFSSGVARDRDRLAAHLHARLAEHAYFMSDTLAIAYGTLNALNRAERVGALAETVEGLGAFAIGLGTAGQHRSARFYRERSIRLAERSGGLPDQGLARLFAAVYSFSAGAWQDTEAHCAAGATIYEKLGDRFRYQSCCVVRAYADIMQANYRRAEAQLLAFGPAAEQVENIPVRAWVLCGLAILDMVLGRAPSAALARIRLARDEGLHRGETLLCDGLEAAAWLQAGDLAQASRCADSALDNMQQADATLGIASFGVCAMAVVQVIVAADATRHGGLTISAGRRADAARRAMQAFARRTRVCRPGALRIAGYLALSQGQVRRAVVLWRRALHAADAMGMPLERALCHLALAEAAPDDARRMAHEQEGRALLQRLGAAPWRRPVPTAWARRQEHWAEVTVH